MAFLLGAVGTVLGTFVSWQLVGRFMGAHDGVKARPPTKPSKTSPYMRTGA